MNIHNAHVVTHMEVWRDRFLFYQKDYGVAWDERLFKIADRYFAPWRFNPKIFSEFKTKKMTHYDF